MAESPFGNPQPPAVRSAGLANGALTLGIISIPTTCAFVGPLLGIVAIVLGAVALKRVKGEPQRYTGRERAVGGIITGVISLLVTGALVLATVSLFKSAMAKTMLDLAQLEPALEAYKQSHQDYPPDLATLTSENLIEPNPLNPGRDPVASFSYVRDVHPSDPARWILAYQETTLGPLQMVAVKYADGQTDVLETAEFADVMAAFRKEYEAARGAPPDILPPQAKP